MAVSGAQQDQVYYLYRNVNTYIQHYGTLGIENLAILCSFLEFPLLFFSTQLHQHKLKILTIDGHSVRILLQCLWYARHARNATVLQLCLGWYGALYTDLRTSRASLNPHSRMCWPRSSAFYVALDHVVADLTQEMAHKLIF